MCVFSYNEKYYTEAKVMVLLWHPTYGEGGIFFLCGSFWHWLCIGMRLSCLHNILWISGWILTKFSWIYSWDQTKNWLDLCDLDIIFKVTAIEKLKILWHFLVWALAWDFVCTISCEPVVGFYQSFMGIWLGHNKELIRFWWPWPDFHGHSGIKTENLQ